MMPLQRVRDAENRMRNKLSNGPRRVQSNVKACLSQSILQRGGIRQLPGICWYPAKRTGYSCESRWHRGYIDYSSLTESIFLSGTFLFWREVFPLCG